jgi:hypothetical protein
MLLFVQPVCGLPVNNVGGERLLPVLRVQIEQFATLNPSRDSEALRAVLQRDGEGACTAASLVIVWSFVLVNHRLRRSNRCGRLRKRLPAGRRCHKDIRRSWRFLGVKSRVRIIGLTRVTAPKSEASGNQADTNQ